MIETADDQPATSAWAKSSSFLKGGEVDNLEDCGLGCLVSRLAHMKSNSSEALYMLRSFQRISYLSFQPVTTSHCLEPGSSFVTVDDDPLMRSYH